MDDKKRFELFSGPYEPPVVRYGTWIACEMRGKVRVGKVSDGNIPWPRKYRTNSLILCGDLVRAVKRESAQAVAYHFGVCLGMVQKWRRALQIPPVNAGTRKIQRRWREEKQRFNKHPEGEPPRRPGVSRRYPRRRRELSTAELRSLEKRGLFAKAWTRGEETLLGTMPDEDLSRKLGRSVRAVRHRRGLLGIQNFQSKVKPWTVKEDKLLGTMSDGEFARQTGRTPASIEARRELLHVPKFDPKIRPWTREEMKLLGTIPDEELAKRLKRTVKAVWSKRVGDRLLLRHVKKWSPTEIKLLGSKSDEEIAKILNRSVVSVAIQRRIRGIPSITGKDGGKAWSAKELAWLGKKPDEEIARLTGRPLGSILNRRFKLGLRKPGSKRKEWSPAELKLLRAKSVDEMVRITGRTRAAVLNKRRKTGP